MAVIKVCPNCLREIDEAHRDYDRKTCQSCASIDLVRIDTSSPQDVETHAAMKAGDFEYSVPVATKPNYGVFLPLIVLVGLLVWQLVAFSRVSSGARTWTKPDGTVFERLIPDLGLRGEIRQHELQGESFLRLFGIAGTGIVIAGYVVIVMRR